MRHQIPHHVTIHPQSSPSHQQATAFRSRPGSIVLRFTREWSGLDASLTHERACFSRMCCWKAGVLGPALGGVGGGCEAAAVPSDLRPPSGQLPLRGAASSLRTRQLLARRGDAASREGRADSAPRQPLPPPPRASPPSAFAGNLRPGGFPPGAYLTPVRSTAPLQGSSRRTSQKPFTALRSDIGRPVRPTPLHGFAGGSPCPGPVPTRCRTSGRSETAAADLPGPREH